MQTHESEQMRQLVNRLNETAYAYYVLDNPVISDKQWDELYNQLEQLEKTTGIVLPDSPTRRVGGEPLSSFAQHTHLNRLWSMDKVQSIEELNTWLDRTERLADGQHPEYFVEYKFDGLTINLTYQNGVLIQASTRGNGITGEAILPQVRTIRSVPLSIPYQGLLEVQGECIMRISTLEAYNKTAKEPLKNARNAAAGALRNLDPSVTASRKLDAFFYQIGTIEQPPYHDQPGMLSFLKENGFQISPYLGKPHSHEELLACIREIEGQRQKLDWLIDGVVIKIGNFSLREQLGYTEKFPRWAVAYKFEAEENVTTLKSVTWELGRTGKLTPLAHLEPVDFYGVTVRKATLNNWGDIQRKHVAIGAPVWIRRSNDVIPEIIGRVGDPLPTEKAIVKPARCPSCGMPLIERGAHLYCMNRVDCRPQAVARITHFASRDAMDIDGLSEKTAGLFYDQLGVREPSDLYTLQRESILRLDGFLEKKTDKLMSAFEKSKTCSLDAFLYAIGILNVGRKTARDLAEHFGSLERIQQASAQELIDIPDIGETVSQSIIDFFSFSENVTMIQKLLQAGVQPHRIENTKNGALAGCTVVVTGTLPTLSRKQAEDIITSSGGHAASSVSKKTAFVVAGEAAGSKLVKAEKLGIEIIDEQEFLKRAGISVEVT